MKVLLSWSGTRSKELALALHNWIPNVIQSVDPWMSESDIDIGSRWGKDLDKELERANFGILCLTPECISSTWIHYEAGALSKFLDKSRVCPYLLDLQPTDIKGPLVNFQAAEANKGDTLKLMQAINNGIGDTPLTDERLRRSFKKNWPDLEEIITKISHAEISSRKPSRTSPDMVEEILRIVREDSRNISDIQTQLASFTDRSAVAKKICSLPHGVRMCGFESRLGNLKIVYIPKNLDDEEKMEQIAKDFRLKLEKNPDIKFGKKCHDVLEDTATEYGFSGKIIRISEEN